MRWLTSFAFAGMSLLAVASHAKDITYNVGDDQYEGYYLDSGEDAPLILMVHDWDGLTEYEKKRAEMLASEGYSVFALDMFGKNERPTKLEDKRQHTGELYQDRMKMRRLLEGGLQQAEALGLNVNNAVAMGYCFGGAVVLEWARSGESLKGFVSVHGGLGTPEGQDYSKVSGKMLIQHGGADTHVTLEDYSSLVRALEQQGLMYEAIVYGGAPHAWTVFEGEAYRELVDHRSWVRQLDFFKEVTLN